MAWHIIVHWTNRREALSHSYTPTSQLDPSIISFRVLSSDPTGHGRGKLRFSLLKLGVIKSIGSLMYVEFYTDTSVCLSICLIVENLREN